MRASTLRAMCKLARPEGRAAPTKASRSPLRLWLEDRARPDAGLEPAGDAMASRPWPRTLVCSRRHPPRAPVAARSHPSQATPSAAVFDDEAAGVDSHQRTSNSLPTPTPALPYALHGIWWRLGLAVPIDADPNACMHRGVKAEGREERTRERGHLTRLHHVSMLWWHRTLEK
ncbi:hypothetical protein U9M48_029911 [Paspalum notatum var. saurae]|uniref:Uncharacterized protein n=1 Tax=Paspalum notatum var. saurae TaxID=547442 RepID=A0AAQ3U2M0_PASNO